MRLQPSLNPFKLTTYWVLTWFYTEDELHLSETPPPPPPPTHTHTHTQSQVWGGCAGAKTHRGWTLRNETGWTNSPSLKVSVCVNGCVVLLRLLLLLRLFHLPLLLLLRYFLNFLSLRTTAVRWQLWYCNGVFLSLDDYSCLVVDTFILGFADHKDVQYKCTEGLLDSCSVVIVVNL